MKKQTKTVGTAIFFAVGLFLSMFTSVNAQVQIINHGGASLPREGSPKGQSWDNASINWMSLLRNGGNQLGVNREQVVRKNNLGDYREILTSSTTRIWKGLDDTSGPTLEYGNRWHQGVQIIAQPGTAFLLSEVVVSVQAFTINGPGNTLVVDDFGEDLNHFRQILNNDNTVASSQDSSIPVTNFLYGGIGIGLGIGSSGTVQERLDFAVNYWWDRNYRLEYTVTVPYTSTENGSGTATSTWIVERMKPLVVVEGNQLIVTNTAPGQSYEVQNSSTLDNWQQWQVFSGGLSPVTIEMIHQDAGPNYSSKMFYRIKY